MSGFNPASVGLLALSGVSIAVALFTPESKQQSPAASDDAALQVVPVVTNGPTSDVGEDPTTTAASTDALDPAAVASLQPRQPEPPPYVPSYVPPQPIQQLQQVQPVRRVYYYQNSCGAGGCSRGIFRGRLFGRRH